MKDYKEKIKKLLALAESPNEHEAKAALLKAKELMAEHKIAEIDLEEVKAKSVKRLYTNVKYTKRGEWWIPSLASTIAQNYCCRYASSRGYGAQRMEIMFVGLEDDVEICAKVFEYAVDSARSCGKDYFSENYGRMSVAEKNRVLNSYAYGFAGGVRRAFDEQNAQKQSDEAGWGLVMVVPQEVNDACKNFTTDRYQSSHRIYNDAKRAGREEGARFNPNARIA